MQLFANGMPMIKALAYRLLEVLVYYGCTKPDSYCSVSYSVYESDYSVRSDFTGLEREAFMVCRAIKRMVITASTVIDTTKGIAVSGTR